LQSLPVYVVIRLCTSEDRIVQYWNGLDDQLDIQIDVLDDLVRYAISHHLYCSYWISEAQEVARANPWLTYGEQLHRMREFGVTLPELDLIDDKPFDARMIRAFCAYL
jgi:hypothetical protein